MMRFWSARRVGSPLLAVMLVLAGCAGDRSAAPPPAGPCDIVANGTPVPRPPAPSEPGARDAAAAPETATGYRTDMTAVDATGFAVA
ncbi:MAG: gamma-glutamyltransferase, partial [Mycobacterium sp.]